MHTDKVNRARIRIHINVEELASKQNQTRKWFLGIPSLRTFQMPLGDPHRTLAIIVKINTSEVNKYRDITLGSGILTT